MALTALDLSPEELKQYRPLEAIRLRKRRTRAEVAKRRRRAFTALRKAVKLLKEDFGAQEVILFGSLARRGQFTRFSDIDLAARGIHPDRFYAAMEAVLYLSPEFKVDLAELETCSPNMLKSIEKDGKPLYKENANKLIKTVFLDINLLSNIFQKYSDIQAVYLFGSVAAGKANANSDIDIAVYPRDSSLRDKKLELLADLARNGFDDVDLVFLDVPNILLRFEAVRHNRLIYCAPDFDADSFFSLILRQYFDFLPYLQVQREAYKQRVLGYG